MRIQFIYQSGRNQAVKKLVDEAEILDILFAIQNEIENNDEKKEREDIIRFCHYMEALVAYLKYYNEQGGQSCYQRLRFRERLN